MAAEVVLICMMVRSRRDDEASEFETIEANVSIHLVQFGIERVDLRLTMNDSRLVIRGGGMQRRLMMGQFDRLLTHTC